MNIIETLAYAGLGMASEASDKAKAKFDELQCMDMEGIACFKRHLKCEIPPDIKRPKISNEGPIPSRDVLNVYK